MAFNVSPSGRLFYKMFHSVGTLSADREMCVDRLFFGWIAIAVGVVDELVVAEMLARYRFGGSRERGDQFIRVIEVIHLVIHGRHPLACLRQLVPGIRIQARGDSIEASK